MCLLPKNNKINIPVLTWLPIVKSGGEHMDESMDCVFGIKVNRKVSEGKYGLVLQREPLVDIRLGYVSPDDPRYVRLDLFDHSYHPSQRTMGRSQGSHAFYSRTGMSDILTLQQNGFDGGIVELAEELGDRNLIVSCCNKSADGLPYHKELSGRRHAQDFFEFGELGILQRVPLEQAVSFYSSLTKRLSGEKRF
jgi:hypothetical protein